MNTPAIQLSIAEVTHLLTTDFDSLRVLETIVERSRQNLSGVWCVLVVRNGEQGYLDVLVESANAEFVPDRTLAISGPAALSAESGAVVMVDSFKDVGGAVAEIRSLRTRTWAGRVPLLSDEVGSDIARITRGLHSRFVAQR